MIRICHLVVSPGHNYFGHNGQPAGEHAVCAVDQIDCVAGRGIPGDRFFDYRPDYKGQITFFAMEVLDALQRELGLAEARPEFTRRNVFTRGVDLNAWVGADFELQGVRFNGTEPARPCHWMNQAFGDPRVEAWLAGRGGLRARILEGGVLRLGPAGPGP
jgi:MOSC domain-containing protein YiiM